MTCLTRGCKRRGIVAGRCRSHARKRADEAFSKFIRARDKFCQRCGTSENLTCAHLRSRTYSATRWDPSNAVALCWPCHYGFGPRPLEWDEWCERRLGREEWTRLKQLALGSDQSLIDSWMETFAA